MKEILGNIRKYEHRYTKNKSLTTPGSDAIKIRIWQMLVNVHRLIATLYNMASLGPPRSRQKGVPHVAMRMA